MKEKNNKTYLKDSLRSQPYLWFYVVVLAVFFMTPSVTRFYFAGNVSDNLRHFRDDAYCLWQGNLPYGDEFARCVSVPRRVPAEEVVFEYPPMAALILWPLGAAAATSDTFTMAFVFMMLLAFIACFMTVFSEAERLRRGGGPDRLAAVAAAAALAALSAGPVAVVSFDIIPAALCLGAVVLLMRNRTALPALLLALSTGAKGYAVVLLPLFLIVWLRRGTRRAVTGAAVFAAVLAVAAVAGAAVSPQGFLRSFTYHSGRGLELNSLYAALLIAFKAGSALGKSFDHGSWNLAGGAPWSGLLSKLSPLMMVAAIAGTLGIAWAKSKEIDFSDTAPGGEAYGWLARWPLAVLVVFILFFKVGSPQFLCWLAPLLPLLVFQRGWWLPLLLFAVAGHAATWVFPWAWESYVIHLKASTAVVLLFEKACLAGLFVWLTCKKSCVEKKNE